MASKTSAQSKRTQSTISSLGLILTAAIWGFAFVIVKDSLSHIGAVWMVAFRFTIAAVLLTLIYCKKLKTLNSSYWKHGTILGFFLFIAYFTQTIGCDYTTAGKNAFLTTIYVILIPLFSWPIYRKRPRFYVFIAAILSVTGIGLLALNGNDGSIANMNKGDILTLICGVFYALHIIFVARFNENEDPILLTVLQFAFAALFGWLTAPFYDGAIPIKALHNPQVILSMLYLGVFSTLVCFVLQNVCLKYVPSALASLFLSLESVFGVLFSTLLLKEKLTLRMTAGCALIFSAILIAEVLPKLIDRNK
ncbi:MAG: DMT family transporter [Treponema sp.]|nr:DMT family transporter [Treponema sp.]